MAAEADTSRFRHLADTLMNLNSSIANNTRELIVQLSRGNGGQARDLAGQLQSDLNAILAAGADGTDLRRQAQQTMYAIEEVLTLIDESDLRGAWKAARDASNEWRETSRVQD